MIRSLLITIIIEGVVVIGYARWRRKPVQSLVLTSICGNLITQAFLWVVLNMGFRYYLIALMLAELLIWIIESILLYSVSTNRLSFANAVLLSLGMNLISFGAGWFLPV